MDILHLRTMARKSVFEAGKHELLSVQQIIDINKQPYLGYQYYKRSRISFTIDVLEELGIVGKLTIKKPGTNPEMYEEWKNWFYGNMDDMERIKRHSVRLKNQRNALEDHEHQSKMSKTRHKMKQRQNK